VDVSAPGCGSGSPCIDPIFGPTVTADVWSATTFASFTNFAWIVDFYDGEVDGDTKDSTERAVRAGS